jgi:Tat protein secretion system quality control protein TatD with DNase activity
MTFVGKVQFAVCVRNAGYPASLELRKLYRQLNDEQASRHGQVRVIGESGEDYLYREEYFVPVKLPQSAQKIVLRATCRRAEAGRAHGLSSQR